MSIHTSASHSSAFDLLELKKAEEAYRFVLRQEPDNMEIRLSLAWSLFFQSLYFSGQEAACSPDNISVASIISGADSKKLLQECLRHSTMVKQLSTRVSSQMDAEKLESLILMAGGKELLIESETRGTKIRSGLLNAICRSANN